WELGARKAKEYLFTGDYIDARTALTLGLVNRVVALGALPEATLELARRIALQDPFALKLAKASVNETLDIQGHRRGARAPVQDLHAHDPASPGARHLRRRRPREEREGSHPDARSEVRRRGQGLRAPSHAKGPGMGALDGRVAVVTGAGRLRGIGRATAVALA